MRIYRIAQSPVVAVRAEQKVRFVEEVFAQLENILGTKSSRSRDGYMLDRSIERTDESHPGGENTIQVSHTRNSDGFNVDITFESEFAHNEWGKAVTVNCDYVNVPACVNSIVKAIDSISRGI